MKERSSSRSRLMKDLTRDPGILILAYPYARTWREIPERTVWESWALVKQEQSAAVYIHIPFCRRKCAFCDSLAYYGRPQDEIDHYIGLLIREVTNVAKTAGQVGIRTVHLGGGTPSLLSSDHLTTLLDSIGSNLSLSRDAQVTMEVFPDSFVTKQQLIEWKRAGINRLSLGFQFFDDELKTILNRTDYALDNLRLFQEAGDVGLRGH